MGKMKKEKEVDEIATLRLAIKEMISAYLSEKSKKQTEQLYKDRLRSALRNCTNGGKGEKEFLKDYIRDILLNDLKVNEDQIDKWLHIGATEKMDAMEKFDILLYVYHERYGKEAFEKLCEKYGLDKAKKNERGLYFSISEEDIRYVYEKEEPELGFKSKVDLLTDKIYAGFGHGCIDRLRDCFVDEIKGGVSGIPYGEYDYLDSGKNSCFAHDSIWVVLKGKEIALEFMSFQTEAELERVTRALVKHNAPYELSLKNPMIVVDMADGSRVTASRPNFAESWNFQIRRFATAPRRLEDIINAENAQELIELLKYLVKGGAHICISGGMSSGKTSLLKALMFYINQAYSIGIAESVFELWMRKLFPNQDILSIKETENVSLEEGIDYLKKTARSCIMLGEVASSRVAELTVEIANISEQMLFTIHAVSTEELIAIFVKALMNTYSDEKTALYDTVRAIDIDVHAAYDKETGRRYIQYVNEIVVTGEGYRINKIAEYKDGKYIFTEKLSDKLRNRLEQRNIV